MNITDAIHRSGREVVMQLNERVSLGFRVARFVAGGTPCPPACISYGRPRATRRPRDRPYEHIITRSPRDPREIDAKR